MFNKRRSEREAAIKAERSAELDALRQSITTDVLAQVQRLITLRQVAEDGTPNLNELNVAVRNLSAAHLNLKFFGFDMARRLSAAVPVPTNTTERHIGLASKLSTQADMETDWAAHWCGQLRIPLMLHRKHWEFAYVLQALAEQGHLTPGSRGLGFGCGEEPLPSYFASRGVFATVTDLDATDAQAAGWAATGQHASSIEKAFHSHLVDRPTFDRHVRHEIADMNAIPKHLRDFDFCWSICALEHVGSIMKGMAFVETSLEVLRPGGVSVHTMEFNINPGGETIDNWPTVLFQRRHLEQLAEHLRGNGHYVASFDWDLGDQPMDRFIDLPPWGHDLPPEYSKWHGKGGHMKVAVDGFIATCAGIIVRKAG